MLFGRVRTGALALMFCALPAIAHAETMREALTSAYLNNPTILSALLNVKATAENIALAKSAKLPTIGATLSATESYTFDGASTLDKPTVSFGATSPEHLRQFQERRRHRGGAGADRSEPLLAAELPSRTSSLPSCRPIWA